MQTTPSPSSPAPPPADAPQYPGGAQGGPSSDFSRRRRLALAAVPVALLASSGLVYQASRAAFTAQTSTGNNTWSSGSVQLSDDDSDTAMFTASGLTAGSTAAKCIEVTYNGDLGASVKLYVSASVGDLRQYLTIKVEQGQGGTFADCTGFVADGAPVVNPVVDDETLLAFATANTNFATGVGAWTPGAAGQKRTYKITYTLADSNDAQNKTASATFRWEAQQT